MATINTGLIVPEVYSQLVREKIAGRMQVGQFLKKIDDLTGDVGETVTMPAWSYVGAARLDCWHRNDHEKTGTDQENGNH